MIIWGIGFRVLTLQRGSIRDNIGDSCRGLLRGILGIWTMAHILM